MAKWIFLEDFELKQKIEEAVNLDYVVRILLRLQDAQIIMYFGSESHIDPHMLNFKTKESCQQTYDNLKRIVSAA